ncbi:hypothetical protein PISMIDRAFT_672380 [Pisolithus microcarpus 441]|uniref:Uncharacterized protein n=1 Tax=Pisolithus microcarpus 441 TaxID=765257 RepID=A0A0C9ZUG2_9AGAM|nr:hypothetical protein PISMIDRAFT_672380 [Pisolithus microcarpus 441]
MAVAPYLSICTDVSIETDKASSLCRLPHFYKTPRSIQSSAVTRQVQQKFLPWHLATHAWLLF